MPQPKVHKQFLERHNEWSEVLGEQHFAICWVEDGHRPNLSEALERHEAPKTTGPSARVLGWADFPDIPAHQAEPFSASRRTVWAVSFQKLRMREKLPRFPAGYGLLLNNTFQTLHFYLNLRHWIVILVNEANTMRVGLNLCAMCLVGVVGFAPDANAGLGQETEITEGLITVGIAYEISKKCDSLGGRRLRAMNYLLGLRSRAIEIGYSSSEIDAFIDNDSEKDRLEAIAHARLASMGAVAGRGDTFCTVGRSEMAQVTEIGKLLHDK